MENINFLQHKMLFFFMPSKITFFKKNKKQENLSEDEQDVEYLKTISPYFYWCSGHQFFDTKMDKKFLFQYQIYYLEDNQINPGEVIQKWRDNKNSIKIDIINFIDMWADHKRFIISPKDIEENEKNVKNFIEIPTDGNFDERNFSNFAPFVARSIITLQDLYIKESQNQKLDILQKRFWENMAMNYKSLILEQNISKDKNKKKRKIKKKHDS